MTKFVTADEAVSFIRDESRLGISSFGGWLGTDELYFALRRRFRSSGHPCSLKVFGGVLPGNLTTQEVGMNILSDTGLVSFVTAAHVGMSPLFAEKISSGNIAAFALPLGVFTKLLRCSASSEPGLVTKVGIGTFCDPDYDSCKLNDKATEFPSPVTETYVDGTRYLFYKSFKLDVCFLKASCADEDGNLSCSSEPVEGDQFLMATAVHNNGGIVIAQVSDIVKRGSIKPKEVTLHNSMVDYVVQASPEFRVLGYDLSQYGKPADSIEIDNGDSPKASPRIICARRAAMQLRPYSVVNLGIGIPDGVAAVAAKEHVNDQIVLSLESGPLGGVPVGGVGFGASNGAKAIYHLANNFDFYDGGGLDIAFLGAAEIDTYGNVNVSNFAHKVTGPGGFINIAQNTKRICFMCTFTAGGLIINPQGGKLTVVKEGKSEKFVDRVKQITFSSKTALERGQEVLYITERAVFKLDERGVVLTEIAPGINLESDVLKHMGFRPAIDDNLQLMDLSIFSDNDLELNKNFFS